MFMVGGPLTYRNDRCFDLVLPVRLLSVEVEVVNMQGTVKWFNQTKGFGFITPSDGSADIFVHYSDIEGTGHKNLREGEQVDFEVTDGQKGPRAANVKVAE